MDVQRLRIGIIGGGAITQIVHLPSLMELADHFEIVSIADPSPTVRVTLAARYGIPETFAEHRELLAHGNVDAVFVLSPASTHFDVIIAALESGMHVFTEKPLCIAAEDAREIARVSERVGRIVQVGYMKRYDPAFEQLLSTLGSAPGTNVRLINGVTYDPGLERLFSPVAMARGDDIPTAFGVAAREREAEQVVRAVGDCSPADMRIYVQVLCDSLIHDVNIFNGILAALDEPSPAVLDTAWWADGRALSTTLELTDGARCTLSILELPHVRDFREEMRIHLDDAVHVLRFPAPYLRHCAASYELATAHGERSHVDRWESWTESFVAELLHFHDCVQCAGCCRTPAQQAAQDLELLERIFKAGVTA